MKELDPAKVKLAQDVAKLFLAQTQASQIPTDVKFMSIEIVIRALIDNDIRGAKKLQFFDAWMLAIRGEITGNGGRRRAKAKTRHR